MRLSDKADFNNFTLAGSKSGKGDFNFKPY